jgi:hypothetical protein
VPCDRGEAWVNESLGVGIHCGLGVVAGGTTEHCRNSQGAERGNKRRELACRKRVVEVRESEEASSLASEESSQLRSGVEPEHQSHNNISKFTSAPKEKP